MPTLTELFGFTNGTEAVLSSNPRAFTDVLDTAYWSTSSYFDGDQTVTWYVDTNHGGKSIASYWIVLYVWPVRSGQ